MTVSIADYALIGDCETVALVSRDGSIDWLCWPRFDSDACFAALLGSPDNGRWRIAPKAEQFRASRRYRDDTLILETRFETEQGAARLIDFMPLSNGTSDLMRLVIGETGQLTMCMELVIRFEYGRVVPCHAAAGPDAARHRRPRHAVAAHSDRVAGRELQDGGRVHRRGTACRRRAPARSSVAPSRRSPITSLGRCPPRSTIR